MSLSAEDIGKTAFCFLSLKMKAIILGIVIGVFMLIIVPILLLSSFFTGGFDEEEEEEVKTSQVSSATGEITKEDEWSKYTGATFIMPLASWNQNSVITSRWGTRVHPVTGQTKKHTGLDLVSQKDDKVIAVDSGVVTERTYNGSSGYGNGVEIVHVLDNGQEIYTFYGHMQDNTVTCKVGETIQKGQVIGIMGTTGMSTGDHLHFEVRLKHGYGNDVDPTNYIFGNVN